LLGVDVDALAALQVPGLISVVPEHWEFEIVYRCVRHHLGFQTGDT